MVTQGPLAHHEVILSGREEMSLPLPPLRGPLLESQPLQFCVLRAHSPHSCPGLLPKPAYSSSNLDLLLHPDPGSDLGAGLPGPLDEMIVLGSPPLTLQFTLRPSP